MLDKPAEFPSANPPLISFVIATYNRGGVLIDCLQKTLQQCALELAPAVGWEVLVVDNASTDGTPELLTQALPQVKLLRRSRNEGPVAKNYGIAAARGELVFFLDDDAFPLPGTLTKMRACFGRDPQLGAAVCKVLLPDDSQECSAYPNVCIGAGTGFRKRVLDEVGYLPMDFFMAAEEYDLSFRILRAGYKVERFEDLPLRHLKSPQARVGQRITELDVRNNLYLLARYVPAPLCIELAADWLSRYWMMALRRSAQESNLTGTRSHRAAFLRGAAAGLTQWTRQRWFTPEPHGGGGNRKSPHTHLLTAEVIEEIFKFKQIEAKLKAAQQKYLFQRVLLADFGKNMLAYAKAINSLKLEVVGIVDDNLSAPPGQRPQEYRGWPIRRWKEQGSAQYEAIIVSNMSPVHAQRRAEELRKLVKVPVINVLETE